jgi:GNAT superfamily N-acetyltransferase
MGVRLNITIRPSTPEDIGGLKKLFLEARQSTFTWAEPGAFRLDDFEQETYGEKILVAIRENEIAGFISLWEYDHFIHHLYIRDDLKGQGIGSALLDAAVSTVGYPLRLKCLERNTKALSFYQKKGFVAKGKGMAELGVYFRLEKQRPAEPI